MIQESIIGEENDPKSLKSKFIAIIEVLTVRFLLYSAIAYVVLYLWENTFNQDTNNWLYLQYIIGSLWFVIPFLIIKLHRKNTQSYGLKSDSLPYSINLGLNAFVILLIVNLGYLILMIFSISYTSFLGSVVLTLLFLLSMFIIFRRKKRKEQEITESVKKYRGNLILIPILLMIPIILSIILKKNTLPIVLTVIWQFIFSGFGEEVFFRGYIQSRLNHEFGCPYKIFNINFGLGLIISSFLFALSHVFNTYSFFTGEGYFSWGWGLFTFVGGLIFGLLREKSKDIYACGLAHGMDAIGEGFGLLF